MSILEKLKPSVDATIASLDSARFTKDPVAGEYFSKIVSVMSSAYKRHGTILETAILEALKTNGDLEVWRDDAFPVSQSAGQMVKATLRDPTPLMAVHLPQETPVRTLQVDALVFNKVTKSLTAYEVKRGNGLHDAGKKRSMMDDILCTQVLLSSYGQAKGYTPEAVQSRIIFYYGKCSIGAPWALKGDDLDQHFGFQLHHLVEEVNDYYRKCLSAMLTR
jgi:hypothetical protein